MKHLKAWMKPEKRSANKPMNFLGGKSQVRYYPKGVVGIISPWNLPFGLTVAPLTSALAAGNRALLKPSEFVPETAALFAEVVPRYFAEEEVAVVTGGAAISQQFAELPFDHLAVHGLHSHRCKSDAVCIEELGTRDTRAGGQVACRHWSQRQA